MCRCRTGNIKKNNIPFYFVKRLTLQMQCQRLAPQMTTTLRLCFPALEKVKFKDCDFDHFLNYRNNSMLNFGEMNLGCILLGLAILLPVPIMVQTRLSWRSLYLPTLFITKDMANGNLKNCLI